MVYKKFLISISIVLSLTCFVDSVIFASYILNLGVYSQEEAEAVHKQLSKKGYPVYLLYGKEYEVRIGNYNSRIKAEQSLEKLKGEEKIVAKIQEEEDLDQYPTLHEEESEGKAFSKEISKEYRDVNAQKIMSLALNLFGQPYKYGGTSIGKGIDCSFFSQTIFKGLGIDLPRTSGEQFHAGQEVDKANLQVGDLVFFQKTYISNKKNNNHAKNVTRINHVGIYIGNGEFIHATINAKRVTISRLDEDYFVKRFAGARRILQNNN